MSVCLQADCTGLEAGAVEQTIVRIEEIPTARTQIPKGAQDVSCFVHVSDCEAGAKCDRLSLRMKMPDSSRLPKVQGEATSLTGLS